MHPSPNVLALSVKLHVAMPYTRALDLITDCALHLATDKERTALRVTQYGFEVVEDAPT